MITITERALEEIIARRPSPEENPDLHLRVDVIGGARSGFAYDLFFDRAAPSDHLIEQSGITLLIRPDSARYLDGTTLDWVETENGAGFVISNPQEPQH